MAQSSNVLTPALKAEVHAYSRKSGIPMRKIIEDALRQYLKDNPLKAKA